MGKKIRGPAAILPPAELAEHMRGIAATRAKYSEIGRTVTQLVDAQRGNEAWARLWALLLREPTGKSGGK